LKTISAAITVLRTLRLPGWVSASGEDLGITTDDVGEPARFGFPGFFLSMAGSESFP
jgi:hypothetical protein